MYFDGYFGFLAAILVCMLFSGFAGNKVKSAFAKHDRTRCRSGYSGYDTASRLLWAGGVRGISIGKVSGALTDHYHPAKGIVNLSESTYGSRSVAAVAVAAHEVGHVMQRQDGWLPYRLRTALVPVVNIGSRLALPLVLVGLLLDGYSMAADPEIGFKVAMFGVLLYGGSLLFALVTLPVELNASRRAARMLTETGILTQEELPAARKVLSAAAMTYLASLLTSMVYFLRFFTRVRFAFGRGNNRR